MKPTLSGRARRRRIIRRFGVYLGAFAVLLFFAAPLVWMVSTAFKPQADWFSTPPRLLPEHPTLSNFSKLLDGDVPRYFLNSGIVATLATIPTVIIAIGAAYAIRFLNFGGRGLLIPIILLTQLLPTAITVLPLYRTAARLDALDSLVSLAIAYMSFTTPVAVWLLYGFMRHLPMELQEAAQTDGCTKFQAFRKVVLPTALPGIVATAVYVFFASWQEFILALTFISSKDKATLPVGILDFIGEHSTDWGQLMAASVALTIPLFVMFAYLQRFLIGGLAAGSVKG